MSHSKKTAMSRSMDKRELHEELKAAAEAGDLARLERALRRGADPLEQESYALVLAADHGHVDCLLRLLPVSDPRSQKSLALRCAAQNNDERGVQALLPVSDPEAGEFGYNALAIAAERGHVECLRLLLAASDPAARGFWALRKACDGGSLECVAALLARADPPRSVIEQLRQTALEGDSGLGPNLDLAGLLLSYAEARELGLEAGRGPDGPRAAARL